MDTSACSVLASYYPQAFPSLWTELDSVAVNGTLTSVREVLNELKSSSRAEFLQTWAESHRSIFAVPDDNETVAVQEILAIPHFQSVISAKAMMRGSPVADPFIVANAMVHDAVVITEESYRENAAKIPNICEHFDVQCNNLEWFMIQQGWSF